ncbi:MAG: P-loop NTPase [Clostridia bacterium]|nr:P-loop NTPase [Clostridia bacterium]
MEGLIAITSALGGVGKSTIASHLAISLWEKGKRVLLIDAEASAPSIDILFGLQEETVYTLSDVLAGTEPQKAVLTVKDGLFILPSAVGADIEEIPFLALSRLKKDLATDFILLLSPRALAPSLSSLASVLLLVTTPEEKALRATEALTLLLSEEPSKKQYFILNKTAPYKDALSDEPPLLDMIDQIGLPLLAVFPTEYEKRVLSPIPVVPHKRKSSNISRAALSLAERILGQSVPLLSRIRLDGFSRRYYIERAKSKKD